MTLKLSFLGGAGTVTGSKFLIEHNDRRADPTGGPDGNPGRQPRLVEDWRADVVERVPSANEVRNPAV